MNYKPHPDKEGVTLQCVVITVSDTRTEETDKSGQIIQQLLTDAGHEIAAYGIVEDEPKAIKDQIKQLSKDTPSDVFIFNGGTGIAPRDTTYDAIASLLDKTLPGFGEIFRHLSFHDIGSRAIALRAIAGVYQDKLIFSLPGSSNAVKLGMTELILPEVVHLVKQLQQ
ncbi:Molybdenum cofactor biosynthesis protein B [Hyella patelloides LEGE 07179]|uniref:Molybdenum cofactor biosynthesis protein B n=1 Tax=Hyella patelloides LEGE 07179 TaxID=945734 RepID=A0A563VXG9_9CYAN|nr:MogA/MoaB family molybdenum cofactor biosynthesis protein [Hyella patelloides]VEP16154.1 Molybdenum cofactor biosynthesis protein B [Hyella patelloides LEGE 07179]